MPKRLYSLVRNVGGRFARLILKIVSKIAFVRVARFLFAGLICATLVLIIPGRIEGVYYTGLGCLCEKKLSFTFHEGMIHYSHGIEEGFEEIGRYDTFKSTNAEFQVGLTEQPLVGHAYAFWWGIVLKTPGYDMEYHRRLSGYGDAVLNLQKQGSHPLNTNGWPDLRRKEERSL